METPAPAQVSVSGSIVIEGHLGGPSNPSLENSPVAQPPSRWKFWQRWKDFHKVTAYATLLLAGGTIALAIFSLIQIGDFRYQERRQLRPYVYAIPHIDGFAEGQTPTIQIELKNRGQTAAFNPNATVMAEIRAYPQADLTSTIAWLQPAIPTKTADGIGAFIFGEHVSFLSKTTQSAITHDDYLTVQDGTKRRLYVWGRVLYLDTFARIHHLNYCFTFDGQAITTGNYFYCVDYNDTDLDG